MQTMTIRNKHASVTGAGIASHNRQVVYLSAVGHKTSLKSIWGTVISANGTGISGFGQYNVKRLPGTRYAQYWTPLPESTAMHMILVAEVAQIPDRDKSQSLSENGCYILAFHPEGAMHLKSRYGRSDERKALREQVDPELRLHLVDRLSKMLSIAVLPEWAPYLWKRALGSRWDDRGLVALDTDGDCIAGYWINPDWRWTEAIQVGLQKGHIRFPGDEPFALPKAA
jgi:hypothetical protein